MTEERKLHESFRGPRHLVHPTIAAYVYTGSVWFKICVTVLMHVSRYFPQSLQAGVIIGYSHSVMTTS